MKFINSICEYVEHTYSVDIGLQCESAVLKVDIGPYKSGDFFSAIVFDFEKERIDFYGDWKEDPDYTHEINISLA